jgi:glutathione S-transferase
MTKFDNDPIQDNVEAPYLKVFSGPTTNGRKVTIFAELLKVNYVFRNLDYKKDTKEPWYLALNPVGRLPLITDVNAKGEVLAVAESAAILQYLAEKYDTEHKLSYATSDPRHWEEVEFLFFHATTLGVSQTKYNQTKTDEAKADLLKNYRLFNDQLKKNGTGYLVGDHFSLAEAISLAHVDQFLDNIDAESVAEFTELKKWHQTLINLPEVQAAYHKTD